MTTMRMRIAKVTDFAIYPATGGDGTRRMHVYAPETIDVKLTVTAGDVTDRVVLVPVATECAGLGPALGLPLPSATGGTLSALPSATTPLFTPAAVAGLHRLCYKTGPGADWFDTGARVAMLTAAIEAYPRTITAGVLVDIFFGALPAGSAANPGDVVALIANGATLAPQSDVCSGVTAASIEVLDATLRASLVAPAVAGTYAVCHRPASVAATTGSALLGLVPPAVLSITISAAGSATAPTVSPVETAGAGGSNIAYAFVGHPTNLRLAGDVTLQNGALIAAPQLDDPSGSTATPAQACAALPADAGTAVTATAGSLSFVGAVASLTAAAVGDHALCARYPPSETWIATSALLRVSALQVTSPVIPSHAVWPVLSASGPPPTTIMTLAVTGEGLEDGKHGACLVPVDDTAAGDPQCPTTTACDELTLKVTSGGGGGGGGTGRRALAPRALFRRRRWSPGSSSAAGLFLGSPRHRGHSRHA
jgi:hypothetical protein